MEKEIQTCPKCNAPLKEDSLFCKLCGTPIKKESPIQELPSIEDVDRKGGEPQEIQTPVIEEAEEIEEPITGVFAEGLPQWNLEPPQVMVRRKRSR